MEEELSEHPLGSITSPLPEERLLLRQNIGMEQMKRARIPPSLQSLSLQYPSWKFYSSKDHIYRVYGLARFGDGDVYLKTINEKGEKQMIPPGECIILERWRKRDEEKIWRSFNPAVFWDPLGYELIE